MSYRSHTCTDSTCYFCQLVKRGTIKEIAQSVTSEVSSALPEAYQNEINKSGGYLQFRDLVILENMRAYSHGERDLVLYRIRQRAYNRRKSKKGK